jgi:uncharacterized heparinase superfamily protein
MSTLKRVASMTFHEVACRARQRADRWVDAVRPAFGPAGEPRRWRERRAPRSSAVVHPSSLDAAAHRFFAGASDLSWLVGGGGVVPWKQDLVQRASEILTGRFDLLGYERLEFGRPIDWHLDPVSGRRAPLIHWSRVRPLDPQSVGDSKVVWELNRHQWMVTLGQAYRITGDEQFAECILDRLDEWVRENPYPRGINWASSLEASLRLIAWCWTLFLIRDSHALTAERLTRWQTLMRAHARHIERYLSHYFSPNTHLTGEALGLVYAGTVLADCADAARWRDVGRRVLIEELRRQVSSDGVYFEQATCYQRYTAEIYLHLLMLAARNRLPLPPEMPGAVARLVRGLMAVMLPDHSLPNIGDADGGWVLPLTWREPNDCRGTFALAAVLFNDSEFAWAAGYRAPEISWFLGKDGTDAFASLPKRAPAGAASTVLPRGGYAVMRSGWNADAHQLIFDVGPLGCPVSGAHGHADLLSVQCVAFGEPFIVDPGTYCYTPDPMWRDHFRSTTAHSTVVVDGQAQADPSGPFSWRLRPAAQLSAWESNASYDYVDALHDAYNRMAHPVRHRRRVLFLKSDGWVVIDDLATDGEHMFEVRFQFSPRVVTLTANGWARAQGSGGRGLWVYSASSTPLASEVREGQHDPIDGWVSTAYGVRHPAPALVSRGVLRHNLRVVTVLLPADPLLAAPPALEISRAAWGEIVGVRFPQDDRLIQFDNAALTVQRVADRQRTA